MENYIRYEKVEQDDHLPIKLYHFFVNNHGEIVPKHWHNSIEILVPVIGDLELWLESFGITEKKAGSVYIVNSQLIHSVGLTQTTTAYMGFALQIKYDFIKNCFDEIDNYYFLQPTPKVQKEILKIIYDIISLYDISSEHKNVKIIGKVYILIYILLENLLSKKDNQVYAKRSSHTERVLNLIEYIETHYRDELTVAEIAEQFHLSCGYLSKYFKENLDMTIKEYIVSVRLQHAREELLYTDASITDISYLHGFPNLKSFTHSFKKRYHMNPKEYREMMRK